MIDLGELSPEQLVLLIAKAKQILYPEAVIVGDELECSQCHNRGVPLLVEDGMTVTHDLDALSAERIAAREGGTAVLQPSARRGNGWY